MRKMKSNVQHYSKLFYTQEAIETAIHDYKRIAAVKLSIEADYYKCEFSKCIVDPMRVMYEFDNYLIELLNLQGANVET